MWVFVGRLSVTQMVQDQIFLKKKSKFSTKKGDLYFLKTNKKETLQQYNQNILCVYLKHEIYDPDI